jgi:hypothetical protein
MIEKHSPSNDVPKKASETEPLKNPKQGAENLQQGQHNEQTIEDLQQVVKHDLNVLYQNVEQEINWIKRIDDLINNLSDKFQTYQTEHGTMNISTRGSADRIRINFLNNDWTLIEISITKKVDWVYVTWLPNEGSKKENNKDMEKIFGSGNIQNLLDHKIDYATSNKLGKWVEERLNKDEDEEIKWLWMRFDQLINDYASEKVIMNDTKQISIMHDKGVIKVGLYRNVPKESQALFLQITNTTKKWVDVSQEIILIRMPNGFFMATDTLWTGEWETYKTTKEKLWYYHEWNPYASYLTVEQTKEYMDIFESYNK